MRLHEIIQDLPPEEVLLLPILAYFIISLQIKQFFRVGIKYRRCPAYCVRLDRVPGLHHSEQEMVKSFITKNKQHGTNAIP